MLAWLFTSLIRDALFFLGYLNDRSSFPKPLSAREERACLRRMQEGDDSARRALIEHNLRLVAHIARKYTVPGCDADDLVSIGAIGLIKAVNTFRPDSGTTLSTYASRCIENEILMCLRSSHKRRNDVSLEEPVGSDSEGNEITPLRTRSTAASPSRASARSSGRSCPSANGSCWRCATAFSTANAVRNTRWPKRSAFRAPTFRVSKKKPCRRSKARCAANRVYSFVRQAIVTQ